MKNTEEQMAYFKNAEFGIGHTLLESVAGSGKTTSIVQSLNYIDDLEKILCCSFTTLAAGQLNKRIRAAGFTNVTSSTLNSVGWGICRQNVPGCDLDANKTWNIFQYLLDNEAVPGDKDKIYNAIKGPLKKLVSYCKAYVVREKGEDLSNRINELAQYHSVDLPEGSSIEAQYARDNLTAWVIRVFEYGLTAMLKMDYDDQKFFPVWFGWGGPAFDKIIIDECQDCNECDIALVKILMAGKKGCRTFWVGDRMQAIYLFRGSLLNAMDVIRETFNCTYLTLSVCWRCADDILIEPKTLAPLIRSPQPNPKGKGTVGNVTTREFLDKVAVGDYVLCRTTAPLIKRCLQLVREGKPAKVKGREVGRSLLQLIDKIIARNRATATSLSDFVTELSLYCSEQVAILEAAKREESATRVQDECEALTHFCTDARSLNEVAGKIRDLFTDDEDDSNVILLLTGHKSKGLEADTVWVLRPDLLPFPKAKTPHEIEAEKRLKYVVLTRAALARFSVLPEKDEMKKG